MKKSVMLLLMFVSLTNFAQKMQWKKTFGGKHAEYLYDGLYTLDYGFLMLGGSLSSSEDVPEHLGLFDAFVIKIDQDGNKERAQVTGGKGNDLFRCVANTQDGGYLLAASSDSPQGERKKIPGVGADDVWLIQINIAGEETHQVVLGGKARDYPVKVLRSRDGGYLIGAVSYSEKMDTADSLAQHPGLILKQSPAWGSADYWIVKLNSSYEKEWEISLGGHRTDILTGLVELPDGTVMAGGFSNSSQSGNKTMTTLGANDWWLTALSPKGKLLWQKQWGSEANDELYALAVSRDGYLLAGGFMTRTDENSHPNSDMVLMKINSEGQLIWKRTFDQADKDMLQDIHVNKDSSIILGAYATTRPRTGKKNLRKGPMKEGNEDFLLIKTRADGQEIWRRSYGTPGKDVLSRLIELRDGGYVLMGTTRHPETRSGNTDFLLIKISDEDKPQRKPLPVEAVPNPAGDYTRIVIGKKYETGRVRVSDLQGHLLNTFDIEHNRIIPLRMSGYAPGIYVIQVEADDMTGSIKVIKQ